jgi:hypothetical protein
MLVVLADDQIDSTSRNLIVHPFHQGSPRKRQHPPGDCRRVCRDEQACGESGKCTTQLGSFHPCVEIRGRSPVNSDCVAVETSIVAKGGRICREGFLPFWVQTVPRGSFLNPKYPENTQRPAGLSRYSPISAGIKMPAFSWIFLEI